MKDIKKSDLPYMKTSLPGPKSKLVIERYVKCFGEPTLDHLLHPNDIRRPRTAIHKGYGCMVEDIDGNKFLVLSQATCVTGYSNPEIINASMIQMKKMITRGLALNPLLDFTELLLKNLPDKLSQGRVNHVVSGTESVILAVTLAREYKKRPIILSYHDSHHGFMGIPFQLSGDPRIKKGWKAKISDIAYIPYPKCYRCPFKQQYPDCDLLCLKYIENLFETVALTDQTAGLIIEPILVNGGMYVPPDDYMKGLFDICKKNDILLIIDEVYTGVGKSGKFMAKDLWKITPEILCVGKAIGGGFPLSAVVTKREVTDEARGSARSSGTFSGNLVACAAGIATMQYLEKHNLAKKAEKMGDYLIKSFEDISERKNSIGDVRGRGLLIGVDIVKDKETKESASNDASRIVKEAFDNGLMIRRVGRYRNILALTPSLTLSYEQADKAVEILDRLIN